MKVLSFFAAALFVTLAAPAHAGVYYLIETVLDGSHVEPPSNSPAVMTVKAKCGPPPLVALEIELRDLVGEPLVIYCQPAIDVLPHPEACLITGITPQQARDEGVPEYEFARQIDELFSVPQTCVAGYNSIRFDDEVTRHLLYRNFHEVYLREWRGGNSRWDLIDVVRLWHALRPEGLQWPVGDNGATSFKLERLSKANGLVHEKAHDALSDVDATIAVAKRLKTAQPRLYEHALKLRDKKFAATLLNVHEMAPVVHVSSKIPAARGCMALIVPIAMHPTNSNCVLTFDLSGEVDDLLALDADDIRDRVFASGDDLPEGVERLPLKGVHLNKSPMLSPLATATSASSGGRNALKRFLSMAFM